MNEQELYDKINQLPFTIGCQGYGVKVMVAKDSVLELVRQLDGYVVEREKLYTVEIPDPNRKGKNRVYLTKDPATGKIFVTKGKFYPKTNKQTWLTESEIRKDFDWAWRFRKEVE